MDVVILQEQTTDLEVNHSPLIQSYFTMQIFSCLPEGSSSAGKMEGSHVGGRGRELKDPSSPGILLAARPDSPKGSALLPEPTRRSGSETDPPSRKQPSHNLGQAQGEVLGKVTKQLRTLVSSNVK